jgi:hypothetical protein
MVTYSANDFIRKLTSEEGLPLPYPPISQTGLVDPDIERGSKEIRFAPGTQCSNWVEVPVSMIDEVDHLGNQPCNQREYPYVTLHLKPTTAEGRVLANLLQRGTGPGLPGPMTPPTRPVPTTPVSPPPVPPTPPPGQYGAPANWPTLPTTMYPTPPAGSRHAPDARPGLNTPGPIKGCS